MNRRFLEAAGDLPPDQLIRQGRSARRGAVPEDPDLRRAAHRIALQQRDQWVSQRRWVLPLLDLIVAFLIWAALRDGESDGFSWPVITFLLVLIAGHLVTAWHPARRAELLADPPA